MMALPTHLSSLVRQAAKFGAVGAVGLIVNLVAFNALLLTVLGPETVHRGPLYATAIASVLAMITNWFGNRYWAFRDRSSERIVREALQFGIVTVASLGIPLLCVWVSHYVLGFTSLLADNIANNAVGLIVGSVFRFALYRWWVFAPVTDSIPLPLPPRERLTE